MSKPSEEWILSPSATQAAAADLLEQVRPRRERPPRQVAGHSIGISSNAASSRTPRRARRIRETS